MLIHTTRSYIFAVLLLAVCAALTPRAQAQLVSCTMVEKVVYTPPLTSEPENTTVTVTDLGACPVSPLNSETGVEASGSAPVLNTSCTSLLSTPQPTARTFIWSDGSTSLFTGNFIPSYVLLGLQVTFEGSFSSGKFAGHAVTITLTFPSLSVTSCDLNSTGLSKLYGYGTLTVL